LCVSFSVSTDRPVQPETLLQCVHYRRQASHRLEHLAGVWNILRTKPADFSRCVAVLCFQAFSCVLPHRLAQYLGGFWTQVGLRTVGCTPWMAQIIWTQFPLHKRILASPSRRRGLGKGTAFESLSPVVLSKSSRCSLCSQKTPSLRFEIRPGIQPFARMLPGIDSPTQSATAANCNTLR